MCKAIEKCEASATCRNPVWSHNRTVRNKRTKIAKIMCICSEHFAQIAVYIKDGLCDDTDNSRI